jgi:hypothetical protein
MNVCKLKVDELFCNVNSPSCEVNLLRSVEPWLYQAETRQTKGLFRLKCVKLIAVVQWSLAHLSRNNSGGSATQTLASEQPFGVPSVWVRFTLQGWIRFRIVHFSRWLRLLDPFTTLSNKSNHIIIKNDVWSKIIPCLLSYKCLSRMDNHLEPES